MPRKTFANGFPLPASDLNTYLMDQSVQTYADATARTAALATPTEGMVSYLADTNTAYVYDGSSWNAVVDAKNYGATLPNGAAGRNKIINGAFDFWQRGTSFTASTMSSAYSADRWSFGSDKSAASITMSRQTFTPGAAPVSGYESEYHMRFAYPSGGSYAVLYEKLEDVRTFAGQTVTLSYWAKCSTGTVTNTPNIQQYFGSGGSTTWDNTASSATITTSWQRFTHTVTLASISGKTVGSSSFLSVYAIRTIDALAATIDVWGVQLEAGSVATPFTRAAGTLQGELAACQRYYWRMTPTDAGEQYTNYGIGQANSTTNARAFIKFPVTMRTKPSVIDYSNIAVYDTVTFTTATSLGFQGNQNGTDSTIIYANVASGLTQYRTYTLSSNNTASSYLGFGAEL